MAALRHLGLNRDPFATLSDSPANDVPAEGELNPNQARAWVLARLAQAGGDAALMAPGALGAIAYAAGGSAARLQRLAANAMRHAADEGSRRIEMLHARQAIAEERAVAEGPIEADEPILPLIFDDTADDEPETVATEPAPTRRTLPRWGLLTLMGVSALAGAATMLLLQGTATSRPAPRPSTPTREPVLPSIAVMTEAAPALRKDVTELAMASPVADDRPVAAPAAPLKVKKPSPPPSPPARAPEPPPAPKLVLRYASDQPGAADAASRVAALLRARGHDVVAVRGAPGHIRQASVRYAVGQQNAGEAINTAYETVLRAYQPGVASLAIAGDAAKGTVELWLPDSAAGASRPLRTDAPPV